MFLPQFFAPIHLPWTTAMVLVLAITTWRGGPEERATGHALLVAWLLSKLLATYKGSTEWGILLVDFGLLAVLLRTALVSSRYWPLFATGFHVLALGTHIAIMADATIISSTYYLAAAIWGYLVLVAVAYGAWTAPRFKAPQP